MRLCKKFDIAYRVEVASSLNRCNVCNSDNLDFALRCVSCGSILQQSTRTLDFFSTIYNLWRYPDFILRKIILAEHRNYTILLALIEAIGLSFFALFLFKAGDIYTIELWRLLLSGIGIGVLIFFPCIYLYAIASFLVARVWRSGAPLKGFVSAIIYALHPVALSAIVLLPAEVAVFGSYLFSNNPSPQIINPLPFYFLGFLDFVAALAALILVNRLSRLLLRERIWIVAFLAVFLAFSFVSTEIAKSILIK